MISENSQPPEEFVEVFRHQQEQVTVIVMGALRENGIVCDMRKEFVAGFAAFMGYSPHAAAGPGIEFVVYVHKTESESAKTILAGTPPED